MLWNIFKKKPTNFEQEQLIEKEIIEYNFNIKENIYGIVIKYDIVSDNLIPVITKICDFHCEVLPNIDSIIWAPNKERDKLEPYKVIRYDYIEDVDNNNNLYIVVVNANINDIISDITYD